MLQRCSPAGDQFITPRIDGLLQPAARRHFPFGFGRQPCPRPLAVSAGVIPGNMHHGMIEPVENRARRSFRLGPIGMRHRDPPRRIRDPATDFALEIIGRDPAKTKLQPYRSASVVYRVARTKSPNCRLLTAKQAMANSLTVTSRTGPSPSSGNLLSSDPIRKAPPIGGLQRRGMTVRLGSIPRAVAAEPSAADESLARLCAQQLGLPLVISDPNDAYRARFLRFDN